MGGKMKNIGNEFYTQNPSKGTRKRWCEKMKKYLSFFTTSKMKESTYSYILEKSKEKVAEMEKWINESYFWNQ